MFVAYDNICVIYEMTKLKSKKTERFCVYEEKMFVGLTPAGNPIKENLSLKKDLY